RSLRYYRRKDRKDCAERRRDAVIVDAKTRHRFKLDTKRMGAKSGHFAQQPTASFDHLVSAARFGGRSSVSHCRGSGGLILTRSHWRSQRSPHSCEIDFAVIVPLK